jgi:hypothetical protein
MHCGGSCKRQGNNRRTKTEPHSKVDLKSRPEKSERKCTRDWHRHDSLSGSYGAAAPLSMPKRLEGINAAPPKNQQIQKRMLS